MLRRLAASSTFRKHTEQVQPLSIDRSAYIGSQILDELIIAGEMQESSKKAVLRSVSGSFVLAYFCLAIFYHDR